MNPRYPDRPDDWRDADVTLTDDQLMVGGWQVMQTWERPLMSAMADAVGGPDVDVLEVGFGMGISAAMLVARGCRSYTVIEAHPQIAEAAREWSASQAVECTVVEGFWQEVVPSLGPEYDGILFDTYPMSADERGRNHYAFIPHAARLLRATGAFVYYSDETVDFRTDHLRLLLAAFDEVTLRTVRDLAPPADCEYWHADHMVIPIARKPVPTD